MSVAMASGSPDRLASVAAAICIRVTSWFVTGLNSTQGLRESHIGTLARLSSLLLHAESVRINSRGQRPRKQRPRDYDDPGRVEPLLDPFRVRVFIPIF